MHAGIDLCLKDALAGEQGVDARGERVRRHPEERQAIGGNGFDEAVPGRGCSQRRRCEIDPAKGDDDPSHARSPDAPI